MDTVMSLGIGLKLCPLRRIIEVSFPQGMYGHKFFNPIFFLIFGAGLKFKQKDLGYSNIIHATIALVNMSHQLQHYCTQHYY